MKPITQRTDDELNATIAKWLGWTDVKHGMGHETRYAGTPSETVVFVPVHEYCKSLDAVATAEDHLDTLAPNTSNNAPRYRYAWALYTLVPPERQPFRATARQRAEALVSVIESLAPHEKV